MSFGAGGLAQMTYNQHNLNGGISLPGSGLSSRGANMKSLSIVAPSVNEEVAQAPKSSRAQLLAGLRTAPKNSAVPGTAPATQTQFPVSQRRASPSNYEQKQQRMAIPQTATAASFGQAGQHLSVPGVGPRGHHYTPSQVLSPPAITLETEDVDAQLDPNYYNELQRMNQYLAAQQERLKQQLVAVTQQAQQMGLNPQQAQYYAQMMANQAGVYGQQQQPIIEPVAGQPGLYTVYNPMTGQASYFFDQSGQQMGYGLDMAGMMDQSMSHSPPPATPTFNGFEQQQQQPAQTQNHAKSNNWRSNSPPKHTPTPPREEPMALPPQSANAWRPGHKKTGSLMPSASANTEAPARTIVTPQGNFGPGQNRDGEHPIRQPRGPPALDELVAKPTSKHEGSKNFASRQRRAALNNIISAGAARRSCGNSNASMSPTSERDELVFSSSAEDNDTASIRSGNSSTQRAIGSEKKEREERESRERERKNSFETKSISSEEGFVEVQNKLAGVGLGANVGGDESKEKRRSAVLLMKGAGQRRSMLF